MTEPADQTNDTISRVQTEAQYPTEAIILAGGLGTRLQGTVTNVPKVLAPVAGRPFLSYLINYLRMQGVHRFVFALGYMANVVEEFLKTSFPTLEYAIAVEEDLLGTGGAIRVALQKARTTNVVIANGDTLFKIDLAKLSAEHTAWKAECTLALKPLAQPDRYGLVALDENNRVQVHAEQATGPGALINGGVYILNKDLFFRRSFPQKFSFETDYLAQHSGERQFYGSVQDVDFIDIGTPNDYTWAQHLFVPPVLDLNHVNKTWALFIDRDGVINEETLGEYVLHWEQFIFSKGVLNSFKRISDAFGRLLIVTNQKGVGRGLMSQESLDTIHFEMQREVSIVEGHIDKIYFCTDTNNTSFFRKPNPGMAFRAKQDFPEIDFRKSIMVGNKPSDMQFGRAAGMFTIFLATTNPEEPFPHPDVDLRFDSLAAFAAALPA